MADETDPTEPAANPPAPGHEPLPVLPYRPGDEPDVVPLPPAAMVYRQFGILAFGVSVAAVACVVGGAFWGGPARGGRDGLGPGCCLGLLPWLMSATLGAVVAVRDGPGRPWALLALLVDAVLLGVLSVVEQSRA